MNLNTIEPSLAGQITRVGVGWEQASGHTGQVPPETTRSKDKASGIPSVEVELPELIESLIDLGFFVLMEERR